MTWKGSHHVLSNWCSHVHIPQNLTHLLKSHLLRRQIDVVIEKCSVSNHRVGRLYM